MISILKINSDNFKKQQWFTFLRNHTKQSVDVTFLLEIKACWKEDTQVVTSKPQEEIGH